MMKILKQDLSARTTAIAITVVVILVTCRHWGMPFHWYFSDGQSYGESAKGWNWVKMKEVTHDTPLAIGDNVGYRCGLRSFMKRIVDISPDGQWCWVAGDNNGQDSTGAMNSTGSYVVGWLMRPGATSQPPEWPQANAETKPAKPIVVRCKATGIFSPFDRRSKFEKEIRFFSSPEKILTERNWLIKVESDSLSNVYDRNSGALLWQIPGRVMQLSSGKAQALLASSFKADPLPAVYDLSNGSCTVQPLARVSPPQPGEIDLRQAQLIETSGQNPAKVFDRNERTAWCISIGCPRSVILVIKLPRPTLVKTLNINGQYRYGTFLEVAASLRHKPVAVGSDFNINQLVDQITLTLHQKVHQPMTGQVKEVVVVG